MKFISKIFLLLILTAAFFASSSAHTYHTSLTRIDYNKKNKSLEIEINLFNHDLEKVLENKNKKNIELDKTKDIDNLILKYISKNFIVKDSAGDEKKLVLIGKEVDVDMTSVFIEIDEVENYENLQLQNKIFFESFSEQINLVSLHVEDKKFDLLFKTGDDFKNFSQTKK